MNGRSSPLAGVIAGVLVWRLSGSAVAGIVVAVVVHWLWHVVFHPYGPCLLCGGKRTNKGSTKGAFGRCPLCHGEGERWRLGARSVHKALGRRKP